MSFENIGKRETLPEKVCKTIKESILSGELKGGDVLPTEPELEKQFGVSRAVIRDAVRMLKAQGLIDVKHGKGMFVSHSQIEAFTDALLTSLRRDNASVWDVEQFEQIFLPQVFAVASIEATEDELLKVKANGANYISVFKCLNEAEKNNDPVLIEKTSKESKEAFDQFMGAVFTCTHNKMITLIGEVLISLRKWRTISEDNSDEYDIDKFEELIINKFIQAIETQDAVKAAAMIREGISYDATIVSIMKSTPVGTSPEIPGEAFYRAYEHLKEP